jgi:cyanophycinase
MIAGGRDEAATYHGFDLLPDVVFDQHFLRRNRLQRLLGVLAEHPDHIGLGVDEHTAVQITGRGMNWSVLGQSYAAICLPEKGKPHRIEILKPGDAANIEALKANTGSYAINSAGDLDEFLGVPADR